MFHTLRNTHVEAGGAQFLSKKQGDVAGEDGGRFRAVVTGLICAAGSKEENVRVFVGVDGDHITE